MLEFLYALTGIALVSAGGYAFFDKSNPKRIGSGIFWVLFGVIFIFGSYMGNFAVGILLLIMGGLTLSKNVSLGVFKESTQAYKEEQSQKIGNKIFIPALALGVIAFLIAEFTSLGGLIGLGIATGIALCLSLYYTKEKVQVVPYENSKILQQMGASVILPQLLGALGALFSKAGVGESVSQILGGIVPQGNAFLGVSLYCISMALFTMIMGNAFAAFAVITAGIRIPFVIDIGGNPAVVGALGLTAGYCGTLMTPMAANFNLVPAMILEMKNKNGVILEQIPVGIALLITHIVLMYFWAF